MHTFRLFEANHNLTVPVCSLVTCRCLDTNCGKADILLPSPSSGITSSFFFFLGPIVCRTSTLCPQQKNKTALQIASEICLVIKVSGLGSEDLDSIPTGGCASFIVPWARTLSLSFASSDQHAKYKVNTKSPGFPLINIPLFRHVGTYFIRVVRGVRVRGRSGAGAPFPHNASR